MPIQLGESLPPGDAHAVSVSMPTWHDTEGWAKRDPAVLSQLKSGYPRFYMPHLVRRLARRLLGWKETQLPEELTVASSADLFPSRDMALACREFLRKDLAKAVGQTVEVLEITFDGRICVVDDKSPGGLIMATRTGDEHAKCLTEKPANCLARHVYAVVYPDTVAAHAKSFWQHTGFGISSRFADFWLQHAPFLQRMPGELKVQEPGQILPKTGSDTSFMISSAIANSYGHDVNYENVRLFHTGMSAITHTAIALKKAMGDRDQVFRVGVFGFLYVDTFKVLSKVLGFEFVLYGNASPEDMDRLDADLASGLRLGALFTEFPGNPLLGSLDIARLRRLSLRHDFALVVDDTVGTSVNLDILPHCDVICTSLTKMFSGGCNVMGGSVVLNPHATYHVLFDQAFGHIYQDVYFVLDSATMLSNSLDFEHRIRKASRTAEIMVAQLRASAAVGRVYYPQGSSTQHLYDRVAKPYEETGRRYGFLLSIAFVTPAAAIAFHDALDVAKGPSLGTNFTLMCAYTLLAHYAELDVVAEYGLREHLVRISVGLEGADYLAGLVAEALAAAERQS
ncbi:PLP-dependent transferase [Apiospora kogelbergensis]|uniref:PLP-dependent transferase n=1 Tax=Apiospora kogelbergensis TaxID=1337665 RepID=UPI00312EC76A